MNVFLKSIFEKALDSLAKIYEFPLWRFDLHLANGFFSFILYINYFKYGNLVEAQNGIEFYWLKNSSALNNNNNKSGNL